MRPIKNIVLQERAGVQEIRTQEATGLGTMGGVSDAEFVRPLDAVRYSSFPRRNPMRRFFCGPVGVYELADGVEDDLEPRVVLRLQFIEPASQRGVGGEKLPESHARLHDFDARGHGDGRVEARSRPSRHHAR